jgi:hypothetical protein
MTTIPMDYETHEIALCVDCLLLTANGETEGVGRSCYWSDLPRDHAHDSGCWNPAPDEEERRESRYLAAVESAYPGWNIAPGCPSSCEWCHGGEDPETGESVDQCEPSFSWSSCDLCGSTLGGDRHPAGAFRRVPPADILDRMTASYVATAVWAGLDWSTTTDHGGEDPNPVPLDDAGYTAGDLTPWADSVAREVCASFGGYWWPRAAAHGWTPETFGHDLWLTRNGHGAGFWDRHDHRATDEQRAAGDALTRAAADLGEDELMPVDGGRLDFSSSPSGKFR